jgi:hypothetical protein
MKLFRNTRIRKNRISTTALSRTGDGVYSILINERGALCSCQGYHFSKKKPKSCEHLETFVYLLKLRGVKLKMTETLDRRIKTSIDSYNELTGGIPVSVPIGYTGEPWVGKSLLETQFYYDIVPYLKKMKKPHNILVLDPEKNLATNLLSKWIPKFNVRFKQKFVIDSCRLDKRHLKKTGEVKMKTIYKDPAVDEDARITAVMIGDIKDLQILFGRKSHIFISSPKIDEKTGERTSDGGQATVVPDEWLDDIWQTPIAKWVENMNIGCLVIDSFTQAFAAAFGISRQTWPGRATANMTVLSQIHELAIEYDPFVVMATHHLTADPSNTRSRTAPTGGNPVGYNFKEVMRITRPSGDYRDFKVMRYGDKPKGKSARARIRERGYYTVKPQEEKTKTKTKKKPKK